MALKKKQDRRKVRGTLAERDPEVAEWTKEIGARVRSARLKAGMSQENLGDALNLTFQQVQKYEKGSNRISSGMLIRIAMVLNTPIGNFYKGMVEGIREPDLVHSRKMLRMIEHFQKLPEDLQETVVRIARILRDAHEKS